jgi:hypothetical protein
MKNKTNLIIFILSIIPVIALIAFTGCAPKLEEKEKPSVNLPNGQKFQDTKLSNFADEAFAAENIVKRTTVQDSLKQMEMMFAIQKLNPGANWENKIEQTYAGLEKTFLKKKVSYSKSVYLDLVYQQINGEVSSTVKSTDKKIAADSKKVVDLIRQTQKASLILTLDSPLKQKLDTTQKFLEILNGEIKKLNILPEFKDSFLKELKQQGQSLLNNAIAFDDEFVRAEKLQDSLQIIARFVEKTSTQLNSEDQDSLKKGLALASVLGSLKDAQTGLQAIALVWALLNDQQRAHYFKEANQDLYDFLAEKSAEDIQCMCDKTCKGFKTKIVLNLGVYPKIEKFGFQNIIDLINQKSLNFVSQKVNQVAFDTLQKIGETITEQVLANVAQKRSDLGDFNTNLRSNLSKGLEQEFIKQKIKDPATFLVDQQNLLLDLDTQSSYIRNKTQSLTFLKDKSKLVQTQFEIVEGFLNLPLFSQSPKTNEKTLQTDLVDLLLNPEPRQFLKSLSNNKAEVDLKQQSELLMTASTLLNQLADWKESSFDTGLSAIKADKIITQFKSKDLDRSFFPKSDLTAVTLSIASQVLTLMQSENSPLVLVDNQNQILPVQNMAVNGAGPIALAAATDFKKGLRVPTAKASDLGDFLNAMSVFYQATENIEKTKSQFLLQKNDNGRSLLEDAVSARQQIKLLVVAVANFISNQLIQPNGLVSKSIALNENLKPLAKYELLDQTRAIDSLIKAYELTKIDVYLWTAKNIYYSMNRLLYSDKMKFYQQSTEDEVQSGIDMTKLLETYKNLLPLRSYLSPAEQDQFEQIFASWLKT